MSREILFKAKTEEGKWVEGFYVHNTYAVGFAEEPIIYENHYIYSKNVISEKWFNTTKIEVIPETVGQYTGLTDKNGKKIFEGDIVKLNYTMYPEYEKHEEIREVQYYKEKAGYSPLNWHESCDICDFNCEINSIEVIGNIHDNPELLQENK